MRMVVHPADFVRQDFFFAANTGHIGPEFVRWSRGMSLRRSLVLNHNMKKVLYIGVGHDLLFSYGWAVSRLRRSGILIRLPTALPWANLLARLRRLDCCR